jgi:hypothetical protein
MSVGRGAVDADADYLGAGGFELCNISLILSKFLLSATGEGENVKRQHHALLAFEVAQPDLVAVIVGQGEIGGGVSDFQLGPGNGRLRFLPGRQGKITRSQHHPQCGKAKEFVFHISSTFPIRVTRELAGSRNDMEKQKLTAEETPPG